MVSFVLYHSEKKITIKTEYEIGFIAKLRSYKNNIFLLENARLFRGIFLDASNTIELKLWKTGIIDIDLFKNQFYIVKKDGQVSTMNLSEAEEAQEQGEKYEEYDEENVWINIEFERDKQDESIFIQRLACNSIGNIYLTENGILYGSGNCGAILTSSEYPVKLDFLKEKEKEVRILDIVAGEDFFLILLNHNKRQTDAKNRLLGNSLNNGRKHQNGSCLNGSLSTSISSLSSVRLEQKQNEITANSKEDNPGVNAILESGFRLLSTSVISFGASNSGVLGTGDHVKRPTFYEIVDLYNIGVMAVYCGHEHSIARTLDGSIYYWGKNDQNQLPSAASSPKEFNQNQVFKDEMNSDDDFILEVHCDYMSSIYLSANLTISGFGRNSVQIEYINGAINTDKKDNENFRFTNKNNNIEEHESAKHNVFVKHNFPVILLSNSFLLQNHKQFATQYRNNLVSLQKTMKDCTKYNFIERNVDIASFGDCKHFHLEIHNEFLRIRYALALSLQTMKCFYRNEIIYDDLLFISCCDEMLEIFETYSKKFCDIKSMNYLHLPSTVLIASSAEISSQFYEKLFESPFQQIPNIIQCIETLLKNEFPREVQKEHSELNAAQSKVNEILKKWQNFLTNHRIDLELAEHTKEFWEKYDENMQLSSFRNKTRRVILDSNVDNVPLRLLQGGAFSTNSFALFSDCLCQYGSRLIEFPLELLWIEFGGNEYSIKCITPEKDFTVVTNSHEEKMLWYDQMESAIRVALGKTNKNEGRLLEKRISKYKFSEKHQKFANVQCGGYWLNGFMKGICYLEYPDGKVYNGNVMNNRIEGYGVMYIPRKGTYEGYFKNGLFHGYGEYKMVDGTLYQGYFKDGSFHGHGEIDTKSYTYIGDFSCGVMSGYGVHVVYGDNLSKEKYMGWFRDGKRCGNGVCITTDGSYFEGPFSTSGHLNGKGIAVFENGYYYQGELTMEGPNGKGKYFLPYAKPKDSDCSMVMGNRIDGDLGGSWNNITVIKGAFQINIEFPRCPIDQNSNDDRKWESLFRNWEEQIFGSPLKTNVDYKKVWSKILIYIANEYRWKFRNDDPEYYNLLSSSSISFDKINLKSISGSLRIENSNNNSSRNSSTSLSSITSFKYTNLKILERITEYGIRTLTSQYLGYIKEYLKLAFNNPNHPLYILYEKISDCFCISYGRWEFTRPVSTIGELAEKAVLEWESLSRRIYSIIRKMFPMLPENETIIEGTDEVVSHITLLYPILLHERIYSTLFLLFATKYSYEDELFRQTINKVENTYSEKEILDKLTENSSSLLDIVENHHFQDAISLLKHIAGKDNPIENLSIAISMTDLIMKAYEGKKDKTIVCADDLTPLTIYLVLRAGVPSFRAELAFLRCTLHPMGEDDNRLTHLEAACKYIVEKVVHL